MIEVRRIQFPRDARRAFAQHRLGALQVVACANPIALEKGAHPSGQRHVGHHFALADLIGELLRRFGDRALPRHGARSAERGVGAVERERARDAERIAGIEREDEMAGLEVGAADRVDHADRGRHRPARVDADQLLFRDLRSIAGLEVQAAQPQPQPPAQHRLQRAQRRARQLHAERGEHAADRVEPFVDVAAAQELIGGLALQADPLGRKRAAAATKYACAAS